MILWSYFNWKKFIAHESMKILIGNRFYKTIEVAQNKLDLLYAANRLTDEQYLELSYLCAAMYAREEQP